MKNLEIAFVNLDVGFIVFRGDIVNPPRIDMLSIFVNLITSRMSFYINTVICLITFIYLLWYLD
jgi:hypothetical protein